MTERFLGIDYGTKRVGIALSDEGGTLAFPKVVLENNSNLVLDIAEMSTKEDVKGIVIGQSLNYEGKDNPIMKKINAFKKVLEEKTNLPIYLEPEHMSSVEAARIQMGKEMLDAQAASIILQSFLDRK